MSARILDRQLVAVDLESFDDLPIELPLSGPHFACLVACDASAVSRESIASLAERLLTLGCVYVCCWGPACERVHDVFDDVDILRNPTGPIVMSTWHEDEQLTDALHFMVHNAHPDPAFADGCRSSVTITIGNGGWSEALRAAMADTEK